MSGKRQHYLPRFLLAGFSHRKTRKDYYCWAYRVDGKCYEVNIKNIGVEKFFYGSLSDTVVDDSITDIENNLSALVENLRSSAGKTLDSKLSLLEFIVHISIRTRHMRESYSEAGNSLIDGIKEVMDTPEKLQNLILERIQSEPNFLKEVIERELENRGLNALLADDAKKRINEIVVEAAPYLVNNVSTEDCKNIHEALDYTKKIIPGHVKEGHLKALKKGLTPDKRIEKLENLEWATIKFDSHSLVLGDVGVWAMCKDEDHAVPLAWAGDNVETVVLPISHSHVLIGRSEGATSFLDKTSINKTTISLSKEYFIASTSTHVELIPTIGELATMSLQNSVSKAVDEVSQK